MIVHGLGTDIVSVARIAGLVARHGDRFLQRVYRPEELQVLKRRPAAAQAALAARWAGKEAFIKALGDQAGGVPYRDVEVVRGASGQPRLLLHGAAAAALAATGAATTLLSLSHEHDHALATVILLGGNPPVVTGP